MSAMVKTRPRLTKPARGPEPVEETETELSGISSDFTHVGPEPEAPEEAIREEEGPESWEEWHTEAPDAGRGDNLSIERDFTHGRSRS